MFRRIIQEARSHNCYPSAKRNMEKLYLGGIIFLRSQSVLKTRVKANFTRI